MATYVIDSREELILALQEATQIEHGLMIQYLFAALALKRGEQEGLDWEEAELVRAWKADILRIARDEMGHLGTVFNMLTAIGGVPELRRPHFPLARDRWFPFAFELMPLDEATLNRFLRFEEPQPQAGLAEVAGLPQEPEYEYVGELYRAIKAGFVLLGGDGSLFIGDPAAQDTGSWARLDFPPRSITNVADAAAAIDAIVLQGEGAGADPKAHYVTFRRILEEFRAAKVKNPSFAASRAVVSNPALRSHPESADGSTPVDEMSPEGQVCGLFCTYYTVLLQGFHVYYGGMTLTQPARALLQRLLYTVMSGMLRPLSEIITSMPLTGDATARFAAPTFEIFTSIPVPAEGMAKWTVIGERLQTALADFRAIAQGLPQYPRLAGLVPSAEAAVKLIQDIRAAS